MQRYVAVLRTLVVVLVFATNLSGQNGSSPTDPGSLRQHPDVADAIKVLDAWTETAVASRGTPGLSIGIVYDQQLVWAKGYGFANFEKKIPASPSTVYRIASITKAFTATAIMQLRDAGKLRLDDPVVKHLPWFRIKNPFPESRPITIWNLLTHTSGLPGDSTGVNWNDLKWPTRTEMISLLSEQEIVSPAGAEKRYSNLGYAILGEVIAAVSGEPYPLYIENHILKPLGMTTTYVLPKPDTPGLAVGYLRRVPGEVAREAAGFMYRNADIPDIAAGNLASTVEDLAKFASLHFRDDPGAGADILRGSTLEEMRRVQWLYEDWQSGEGLGFGSVRRVGNQVRVAMEGALPGWEGTFEIAPADKLGVIVLTNASEFDSGRFVDQAFRIVGPAIARATAPPQTTPIPDPAWDQYIGTYVLWKNEEVVEVLVLNGELTMVNPRAENPWNSRVTLKPIGPHTFRMIRVGGRYGELVHFEVDPTGRVTRLRGTAQYNDKVK